MAKSYSRYEYETSPRKLEPDYNVPKRNPPKKKNTAKRNVSKKKQKEQGARCMDCGVPFCQYGQKVGQMVIGCPLNNLIPETKEEQKELVQFQKNKIIYKNQKR